MLKPRSSPEAYAVNNAAILTWAKQPMGEVIQIDEARIRDHLGEMVRGTVEETLNALFKRANKSLCKLRTCA